MSHIGVIRPVFAGALTTLFFLPLFAMGCAIRVPSTDATAMKLTTPVTADEALAQPAKLGPIKRPLSDL